MVELSAWVSATTPHSFLSRALGEAALSEDASFLSPDEEGRVGQPIFQATVPESGLTSSFLCPLSFPATCAWIQPHQALVEASYVRQPCLWRSPVSNVRCLLSPSARQVSSPSRRTFSFLAIHFLRPYNHCRASLGPGPGPTLAQPALIFGPVSGVLCLPTACFTQTLDHNLWPTSHAYFTESAYSVNVGAAKPFEGRGEGDMLLTRSTIVTGLRPKA